MSRSSSFFLSARCWPPNGSAPASSNRCKTSGLYLLNLKEFPLATRLIQFPVRNAFAPIRSHDSLARDTQYHASRIAQQVEEEIARKARRMSLGLRIQFADAGSHAATPSNVLMMPRTLRVPTKQPLVDRLLAGASIAMSKMLGR